MQQEPSEPASVPLSTFNKIVNHSIFKFSSPALEQGYQSYAAGISKWWTLAGMLYILLANCTLVGYYISGSAAVRAQIPPTWPFSMVQGVASAAVLVISVLYPTVFTQHRAVLSACAMLCIMATFPLARAALLWKDSVCHQRVLETAARFLRSFAAENMYLSTMWLMVIIAGLGQSLSLLMSTTWLLVELRYNRFMCGLPYPGSGLVTMSPRLLEIVLPVSELLPGIVEPRAIAMMGSLPSTGASCPSVLGIWQVLGWWIAGHVIFGLEVVRRRSFLRTPAAPELLGPEHLASALGWPFGNPFYCARFVLVVVGLLQFSLLWLLLLPSLT